MEIPFERKNYCGIFHRESLVLMNAKQYSVVIEISHNYEGKMKPYSIGLLTMVTLTLAMAAYSQETKMMATNDNSTQAGATNISDKEEYFNPGEPIKVKAGQKFTIRMTSNPTTGHGWQLSKALDEKVVQLVTNAYIPPDSKLMGAGGYEAWTFKAVGEGQADISMKYVRSWEKDQPARTNVFTVIVK